MHLKRAILTLENPLFEGYILEVVEVSASIGCIPFIHNKQINTTTVTI
jgi:hypothetical protein